MRCNSILTIISTILLFSYSAFSQLHADFTTISSVRGCSPLYITFKDMSTGAITSRIWIFGNGNSAPSGNQIMPIAIYGVPGTYTVTLIVSDGTNSDTIVKPNYITVYSDPVASFSAITPTSGCNPLSVSFIDNSSYTDGAKKYWSWDFGDGMNSNIENPSHTFLLTGSLPVALRVIDENGCTDLKLRNNFVNISQTPIPEFTSNITTQCLSPVNVNFTNQSFGAGALTYLWHFGDGDSSSNTSPIHAYNTFGVYDVTLLAMDVNGCSDTIVKTGYISLIESVADFSTNKSIYCIDEDVWFTNHSVGTNMFLWDFGDGSPPDTVKNPVHSYSTYGNYNVKLISYNENSVCPDTIIKTINVERVEAAFTLDPARWCSAPVLVNFTDQSFNASSWSWDMGNGDVSVLQNPSMYFDTPAENVYTFSRDVRLTVESSHGCKNSIIVDNAVVVTIPQIVIGSVNEAGCVPLNCILTDNSIYNSNFDSLVSREWTLGLGETSSSDSISILFEEPNFRRIYLSWTTVLGCVATTFIDVKAGTPQIPGYLVNVDTVCANDRVQFFDNSIDSTLVDKWMWSFSNSNDSSVIDSIKNPEIFFNDTGYFNLDLTVIYNGCGAFTSYNNVIYVKGPYAEFKYSMNCNSPLTYNFEAIVKDEESFTWNFGDGTTNSLNKIISHTYQSSGDYVVNFSATNSENICVFYSTSNPENDSIINVRSLSAAFVTDSIIGCTGHSFNFNPDPTTDDTSFYYTPYSTTTKKHYLWNFDDGSVFNSGIEYLFTNSPVNHTFTNSGVFNTKLIVEDINGCRDTAYKKIKIYEPKPVIIASTNTGCKPLNTTFNDATPSDTVITSWFWDFGNGNSSDIQNPSTTYEYTGSYDVSLLVTDIVGCTGSIYKPNFINVLGSKPKFTSIDSTLCMNDLAYFINNSDGSGLNFLWDFGDGTSSSATNPSHLYSDTGSYTVSLKVINSIGCDTTALKIDYIKIQNYPVADFIADTLSADCYPLIVSFNDNSETDFSSTWLWNFGDNALSDLLNPIHSFSRPGKFDVRLTVTTSFGCSDSIIKSDFIDVKGPYAEFSISTPVVCNNSEVIFTVDSMLDVVDYYWDFGDGIADSVSGNSTLHIYNDYGIIYPQLVVSSDTLNPHSCQVWFKDTITVNYIISSFTLSDSVLCIGNGISFFNTSFGDIFYEWTFGDGFTSFEDYPVHSYLSPGDYTVYLNVSDDHSCTDTDSMSITINPIPDYIEINDTLKCDYDTITLDAGTGYYGYLWSDNSTSQTLDVGSQSIVIVSVRNTEGCWSPKDTIVVSDIPTPNVDLGNDTLICEGTTISLNIPFSIYHQYLWNTGDTIDSITGFPDSTYFIKISNICGIAYDTILIDKIPLPNVNLGIDTAICIGTNLTLYATGSPYDSYLWNDSTFADSLIVDTIKTYYVTVSNSCGSANDSIAISIIQYPVVSLGNDTTLCSGDSLLLFANSGYDVYTWSNGSTNDSIYISQSNEYSVEVKNACSTASDTMKLIVYDVKINLGLDTIMCPAETITLDAGEGFESYVWNDNTTGQTLTVNKAGTYYVSVTNICAFVSDTVDVFYLPDSVNLGQDTSICEGNIITFSSTDTFDNYLWHNGFNYPVFTTSHPGTYYLTVENKCGTYSDTVVLKIKPLPFVELGDDLAVSYVSEIIDAGDDADSYLWSTGDTSRTIEVTPGNYTVWVDVEKNGCKSSDTIRIINYPYDSGCIFGVPNAFTPNGDGKNDIFHVRGYCIEEIEFMVFNRYGEMVFKTEDIGIGWDGTYNGRLQETEIYVWYLKVKLTDGQVVEKTGNVALIN